MMKMLALGVTIVVSNLMTYFILMELVLNKKFIKKYTKKYIKVMREIENFLMEKDWA